MIYTTLKIAKLIGTDIRSRSNVMRILRNMPENTLSILDFAGVEFVSRSFADELISLIESKTREMKIENLETEVKSMVEIVRLSRTKKVVTDTNTEVVRLRSMYDVDKFFAAI